jgi:hypothetical protein
MDTLEAALSQASPFPAGLFWLHRGDRPPLPRVTQLLLKAATKGVEGGLVAIENFDETLRDLIRLLNGLDTAALDTFAAERKIWSAAPRPSGNRGFPVVRLNGLELKTTPSVCRRLDCAIGGHAEVVAAVEAANVEALATRTQAGVLAFGSDADVRKAFAAHGIKGLDLHPIEVRRLRYESHERGLLRQALSHALAREHALTVNRRHNKDLLAPAKPADPRWAVLRKSVGNLAGTIPHHPELGWREGVATRLDWADDRLWLLFEPRTVFTGLAEENKAITIDFARERTVRRYNQPLNELISFWADLLSTGGAELRALGISAGVDAVFKLGASTAYSRRSRG